MLEHRSYKYGNLGLIWGLCALIGCTSSTSPSRAIPCAELSCIAGYVADNVTMSNAFINQTLAKGRALASGAPYEEEREGWQRCSWDYKDVYSGWQMSSDLWIKLLDTNDQLLGETEPGATGALDKIWASGGMWYWFDQYSWLLHIGVSLQRPFEFEGLAEVDGICTINGITSCTFASESTGMEILMEYSGLTRSNTSEAYPEGKADFTVYYGHNVMCTGDITFNGSCIALPIFTSGESGICKISL